MCVWIEITNPQHGKQRPSLGKSLRCVEKVWDSCLFLQSLSWRILPVLDKSMSKEKQRLPYWKVPLHSRYGSRRRKRKSRSRKRKRDSSRSRKRSRRREKKKSRGRDSEDHLQEEILISVHKYIGDNQRRYGISAAFPKISDSWNQEFSVSIGRGLTRDESLESKVMVVWDEISLWFVFFSLHY